MQKIFFVALGGFLLGYVFPPYNFSFLLFFVFIPLFWWLENKEGTYWKIMGTFFFYLFFALSITLPVFAFIKVSLFRYLSYSSPIIFFFSLFIYLLIIAIYMLPYLFFSFFLPSLAKKGIFGLFSLAFGFSLIEYLFSLFLPDLYLLGYGVGINPYTRYFVSLFGTPGVTFLIVLINLFIYRLLFQRKRNMGWIPILLLCIVIFLFSLNFTPFSESKREVYENEKSMLRFLIVQRAINFATPDFFKELEGLITASKRYENFSPDIVIWPESSVPVRLLKYPNIKSIITKFAKDMHSYLVFGTYGEGVYGGKYNQAMVISPEGKDVVTYSKIKIIPFFEGPPDKRMLQRRSYPFRDRNFIKGRNMAFFIVKKKKFGLLMCSEVLYPYIFKNERARGADAVIILSNELSVPKRFTLLLLKVARIRAIENGFSVIRANTTGKSAFISFDGKLKGLLPYGRKDVLRVVTDTSSLSAGITPYSKYGITFIIIGFLCSIFLASLHNLRLSNKIIKNK